MKTRLMINFSALIKANNGANIEKTIRNSGEIKKLVWNLAKIKNSEKPRFLTFNAKLIFT